MFSCCERQTGSNTQSAYENVRPKRKRARWVDTRKAGGFSAANEAGNLHFDGFADETLQKRLLFLLGRAGADEFDGAAAKGAERKHFLAAFATQTTHAGFAHGFVAFGAAMGHGHAEMTQAFHDAILPHHLRFGNIHVNELRDFNFGVDGFHEQFHIAEPHDLARRQWEFADLLVVDESAVGGFQVAEDHAIVHENDFAMNARNRGMLDGKIVVRMPADTVGAKLQLNELGVQSFGFN